MDPFYPIIIDAKSECVHFLYQLKVKVLRMVRIDPETVSL